MVDKPHIDNISITLKLDTTTVTLSYEDALKVYRELKELFKGKDSEQS